MALAARLDKCRCHSVAVHLISVRERALGVGGGVCVCGGGGRLWIRLWIRLGPRLLTNNIS